MKKLTAFLIALSIVMIPVFSYADTLKTTISGDNHVTAGETFTVTVNFAGTSLDTVNSDVIYDDRYLSYQSGGRSSGDGGIVYINSASENGRSVAASITFKAKKSGDANIVAKDVEAYDLDGNTLSTSGASIYVHVDKAKEEAAQPEEDEEQAAAETEEEVVPEAEPAEEEEEEGSPAILIAIICITLIILIALIVVWRVKRTRTKS